MISLQSVSLNQIVQQSCRIMCTEWTELYTSSQSSRRLDSESRIRIQDFWLLLDPFPDSWRYSMLSDSMKTQNEYNFLENLSLQFKFVSPNKKMQMMMKTLHCILVETSSLDVIILLYDELQDFDLIFVRKIKAIFDILKILR